MLAALAAVIVCAGEKDGTTLHRIWEKIDKVDIQKNVGWLVDLARGYFGDVSIFCGTRAGTGLGGVGAVESES